MGRFRKVDSRIWNDEKFRALSERGQLCFFYLLTHPHMTSLGAMRATPEGLAAELGLSTRAYRRQLGAMVDSGMVEIDTRASFVALPNFLRYNLPESPNVIKAWASALDLIPECPLKIQAVRRACAATEEIASASQSPDTWRKAFREAFGEGFGEDYPEDFGKAMPNPEPEPEPKPEQNALPMESGSVAEREPEPEFVTWWASEDLRRDLRRAGVRDLAHLASLPRAFAGPTGARPRAINAVGMVLRGLETGKRRPVNWAKSVFASKGAGQEPAEAILERLAAALRGPPPEPSGNPYGRTMAERCGEPSLIGDLIAAEVAAAEERAQR